MAMDCLHGKPASLVTTKNGKFWLCDNKNEECCEFFCPEQDRELFDSALFLWRSNGALRPVCHTHQRRAKMRVVKDPAKPNFGRPFFVCSDRENQCSFWQWGDRVETPKPTCKHGLVCCIRKVKKEGSNQGRLFYCCPNEKENSCGFFEWKPRPHVDRVGCLFSYPPSYSYMVSDTGLTFVSQRQDPNEALAEYNGELPIMSVTDAMEKLDINELP